ncbi:MULTISPECIES: MlaA family lipoprotein [Pseudomonas]|uniref:Membrane protein n=1 Tax=Pseudomonas fluorescens TaxID=294 RepID=A0A0D0PS09_PSEFL|nr:MULTISPECIES: VacJ family lipoprotein [Pseudomonas]KIQ61433.1 membrane protein [Pseudomonas fluorescens]BBP66086.1 lipoprotein [Pseudomonas sp. Cab53]
MRWSHRLAQLSLSASVLLVPFAAQAATEEDPWESINRPIFTFNDTLDTYALKPLAQGYQYVTPQFLEDGIHNMFRNIGDVGNLANNVLQAKPAAAGVDTARLIFNTTFGLLGFFDVGTQMGLQRSDEDFGQTLGYWGVSSGPYVVLPLLGPSTLRDAPAKYVDSYAAPYRYIDNVSVRNSIFGLNIVDTRASLLSAEKLVSGDKYVFIRNAYLQNREFKVKDGQVEDDF